MALHVVALDGVFVGNRDGAPVSRALGHLKTDEVADVVQVTKVRILRTLVRRGVVRVEPEALQVDEAFAARDPVLANLAPAAHWRPLVIPADPADGAEPPAPAADRAAAASSKPVKPEKTGRRCRYIKWAELLRLTFGVNVQECPACGGRMELRALVRDPESIKRFLRHQGLWSPPPSLSPARAPPHDRRVARLRASTQQELFPDT